MTGLPPRAHGVPFDPEQAAARAHQLAALADPDRMLLLSTLINEPTLTLREAVDRVGLSADAVAAHVAALVDVHLLMPSPHDPADLVPSADAWMRFGKLLSRPVASPELPAPRHDPLPPVITRIADRLALRFAGTFSPETVSRYVIDSYRLLGSRSQNSQHLPVLTDRFATDRLSALAVASGKSAKGVLEVLFVCVQNSARSQIAAAYLRQCGKGRVHVRTAGSQPAARIDPMVLAGLNERGLPVVSEFPKPLTDEIVQASDYIITMGCGDACPIYPGRRYLDWPVEDPVGQGAAVVSAVFADIEARVTLLCDEILA